MTMGAQDSYTIDELAAAVGMTPRNVRAYRTKGLLPPPVRDGRVSRYRTAHLHRLRDVLALREAGLPLKMIIQAAGRGEDLGPNGALWLAAGRAPRDVGRPGQTGPPPPYVDDPRAYALMQALAGQGVTPATVLMLALRTAHAGRVLALELSGLLAPADDEPSIEGLPAPAVDDVIDLATMITREMLGHTLAE
jgi:DNA-binding transcriptional MerR regulator